MSTLDLELLKGLKLEDAKKICEEHGLRVRIVREDGKPYIITRDFRMDRVNLSLVDKKVINADLG